MIGSQARARVGRVGQLRHTSGRVVDVLGRVNAGSSHAVYKRRVHGDKVLAEDVEAAVDSLWGQGGRKEGEWREDGSVRRPGSTWVWRRTLWHMMRRSEAK